MSEGITIDGLQKNLNFFKKMYDAVRIVDPLRKQVLECRGYSFGKTEEICYEYWKSGKICDNCISIRAYNDNKCFIKLEQSPDLIMIVTALPIGNYDETPVILELAKNATDTMMIGEGDYSHGHLMQGIVSDINDMVIRDPLTSLYNRRFVDDRLPVDIIKATIEKWPLSIIFIDVDNLKSVNDTYGHLVGDEALKRLGNAIQSCIRSDSDWLARYAGDEFLVCLTNTDGDDAYHIAERIRCTIEGITIPGKGQNVRLTASQGIYTMLGQELTAEEIIHLADHNMYEAKRQGKNRTVCNTKIENVVRSLG
ncbi:MAG TPA: GGDEF domain-containing protein [Clostridia bacterium]|nr:GGDEF domain-containing protein [Clostridia bacterium]